MARKRELPKVPRDWLFVQFEQRNLNRHDVAEEIGLSRNYFNNCEKSGLNAYAVKELMARYNIDVIGYLEGPGEPEQLGMFSKEEEILLAILNELHAIRKYLEGGYDSE